jgi:hypothetical protein
MSKRQKSAEHSGYQGLLAEPMCRTSRIELGDPKSRQKYAADWLEKIDLLSAFQMPHAGLVWDKPSSWSWWKTVVCPNRAGSTR